MENKTFEMQKAVDLIMNDPCTIGQFWRLIKLSTIKGLPDPKVEVRIGHEL